MTEKQVKKNATQLVNTLVRTVGKLPISYRLKIAWREFKEAYRER